MLLAINKLDLNSEEEKSKFIEFIFDNDDEFTPSLSSRVDLCDFSKKLITHSNVFYANLNEKNVGYLSIYMNDKIENSAFIPYLAVSNKHRGLGLSKELLSFGLSSAKKEGFVSVELTARYKSSAFHLYEKFGFEIIEDYEYSQDSSITASKMKLDLLKYDN